MNLVDDSSAGVIYYVYVFTFRRKSWPFYEHFSQNSLESQVQKAGVWTRQGESCSSLELATEY